MNDNFPSTSEINISSRLEILSVSNGYILKTEEGTILFETGDREVEVFADLLRAIDDHMGPPTSRYAKKRIMVKLVRGDKFTPDVPEPPLE